MKSSFADALVALNTGKRIAREGWNGKGLFVYKSIPSIIDESVVASMQSVPESVKQEFIRRGKPVSYSNQLAIVNPDNQVNGWIPSPSDIFSNDWLILD